VLAVATGVLGILVALQVLGEPRGIYAWTLLVSSVSGLVVWRGSSDDERTGIQTRLNAAPVIGTSPQNGWRWLALRAGLGAVLVIIGISVLSRAGNFSGAALVVLLGSLALGAGMLMIFAPWWLRTLRELSRERRERVRAQERADMAAHVHDSVLQTLSLIRKVADNPAEVTRLARNEERELRSWLFDPGRFGRRSDPSSSFAAAVAEIERDIEDNYGVGVELIVVGDCALDDHVSALVAAGREAAVNAAKWSGAPNISVFAEVELQTISLFVRDLGRGFDRDRVPPDRQGIAKSIVERMDRHGGRATIRSGEGAGTEVELVLDRAVQSS